MPLHRTIATVLTLIVATAALGLLAPAAAARTLTLDASDIEAAAFLDADAPELTWAANESAPGVFTTHRLQLRATRAVLLRYNVEEIPEGMRVTRAEWVLPVVYHPGRHVGTLNIWRVIPAWGPGACYRYRIGGDEPVPWNEPGASAPLADRAMKPTYTATVTERGEVVVDVTADVEMWRSGAAANRGWMITLEQPHIYMHLESPLWLSGGQWHLRITYEPE